MECKRFVCAPIFLMLATFQFSAAAEERPQGIPDVLQTYGHGSRLERIVAMWNKSSESFRRTPRPHRDESEESTDLPSEISNCILERQYQITENLAEGKRIILNCFKATLMLNMLRYLGESRKSSVKLFDGLVELKRIPEKVADGCEEERGSCSVQEDRKMKPTIERKEEYVRMYKKAMQKLISERRRLNAYRNQTEEEKAEQLNRIDEKSEAFLSEVMRALGDEKVEEEEEEKLRKEMADGKLLSVLDAFSKHYMVKLRFYPGAAARMMRSENGGFTFDVEVEDSPEEVEEKEDSSDESSTREIKDGPQGKDYLDEDDDDDDDDDGGKKGKKPRKGSKKKKKQMKKKAKELKKIIPYLLLPMLIQMTLLPFVFKKLFFLAMKALFAGKMALILIGFNLLRNTCIKNDDDYQKIRVEHYGYRKGEEYGAWVNGRSLGEAPTMAALSEEPFRGHVPSGGEKSI